MCKGYELTLVSVKVTGVNEAQEKDCQYQETGTTLLRACGLKKVERDGFRLEVQPNC
jgi:hypothetical protein